MQKYMKMTEMAEIAAKMKNVPLGDHFIKALVDRLDIVSQKKRTWTQNASALSVHVSAVKANDAGPLVVI